MPDLFTAKKKHTANPQTQHTAAHEKPHRAEKVVGTANHPELGKVKITTDPDLPTGKINFFTNFRLYPEGLTVQNQEADEILILFLRRDQATNIPWIVVSVLLLFLPAGLMLLPSELSLAFLTAPYWVILNLFYYLLVIGFVMLNFVNWFYNISIVTTQRIIDIDYANITYKHVGATTIENVEDISYSQAGFLRSFFDFGNVLVQTKGEIQNFDFNEVPKPAKVVDIIIDLVRGKKDND